MQWCGLTKFGMVRCNSCGYDIETIMFYNTYLVIRRLSKKLGEPWRRGIDGERDLLETELLDVEREDLLETLLDDRDELEKLLRLCLELNIKKDYIKQILL